MARNGEGFKVDFEPLNPINWLLTSLGRSRRHLDGGSVGHHGSPEDGRSCVWTVRIKSTEEGEGFGSGRRRSEGFGSGWNCVMDFFFYGNPIGLVIWCGFNPNQNITRSVLRFVTE